MKKVLALILSVFVLASFSGCRTTVDRLVELKDNAALAYRMAAGVTIILEPDVEDLSKLTWRQMDTASAVLRARLDSIGYWDAEVNVLNDNRIGIIFPKKAEPEDAGKLIEMLSRRAVLEFCYVYTEPDEDGNTRYATAMEGTTDNIYSASVNYGMIEPGGSSEYYIDLTFTYTGSIYFKLATENVVNGTYNGEEINNVIAIILDGDVISAPSVSEVIDSTNCIIHGDFDADNSANLADLLNSAIMPFGFRNVEIVEAE